jgi:hypothetical protein
MSRIAMNMPRHMAAKPAQAAAVASGLSGGDDVIWRSGRGGGEPSIAERRTVFEDGSFGRFGVVLSHAVFHGSFVHFRVELSSPCTHREKQPKKMPEAIK